MKTKKLFCLSDEAIEKLQKIAEKNNLSLSQTVEALIMCSNEDVNITVNIVSEYKLG